MESDASFEVGLSLRNSVAASGPKVHLPRHELALAGGHRFEGVELNLSDVCKGSGVTEKEPFYGLRKRREKGDQINKKIILKSTFISLGPSNPTRREAGTNLRYEHELFFLMD